MHTSSPTSPIREQRTIIFDFDGTLVDIELIFFKIINRLAPEFGYASIRVDEIPSFKKIHLRSFIWRRLGIRIFLFWKLLRRGREEYHKLIPEVNLFPGIHELLATLRSRGFSLGVVSSSREDTIHALLAKFEIHMDFVCQCDLFSKSKKLSEVIRTRNLSIDQCLYVGDEVRDIESCRKINLDIIAVTWGLNDTTTLKATGAPTVNTPTELLEKILRYGQ